jgi:hypothetical protein
MHARLVQEVEEKRSDARHQRAPSASPSGCERAVMVRLERDLERADVAIVLGDDRTRVVDRRVSDDPHMRDTLDRDPLAGGCRGSTGGFGGVM